MKKIQNGNPVAKFSNRINKASIHRDKTKYRRTKKHKSKWTADE